MEAGESFDRSALRFAEVGGTSVQRRMHVSGVFDRHVVVG